MIMLFGDSSEELESAHWQSHRDRPVIVGLLRFPSTFEIIFLETNTTNAPGIWTTIVTLVAPPLRLKMGRIRDGNRMLGEDCQW